MNAALLQTEMFDGVEGALAFISSVLEASTEYSMIATDPQGVILLWNEGARRQYGYEPNEVIGRHKSLLHAEKDRRGGVPEAMMQQTSQNGTWHGMVDRVRRDGTTFTAQVVMTERLSHEGKPIGYLLMSRDITAEQRLAALVESKAEQLAISLRYKAEFFSNMSHELRTPLNSLLILAELLQDNPDQTLTTTQIRCARMIHSAGADLLRLLNDILQLAEAESGKVSAEIDEVVLAEIQASLQRDFDQAAREKGLALTVELAAGLPAKIATDAALLLNALGLLLANALKFTAHGKVTLRVSPANAGWSAANETLERASAVILFSVTDTGIGMTAEVQRRIFDDFVQGDGTTSRQYNGAGLGLSIGRELIRALGGEINVTSSPRQGSTFNVYLPTTYRHGTEATLAPELQETHHVGRA